MPEAASGFTCTRCGLPMPSAGLCPCGGGCWVSSESLNTLRVEVRQRWTPPSVTDLGSPLKHLDAWAGPSRPAPDPVAAAMASLPLRLSAN